MGSFDGLETFVRVAQTGGFSAAARDLGMTPSAVSKQIARLEDRLGARLFNRTTRRLALTEEGQAFHDRTQRILADVAEAEQAVANLGGALRGLLRINVPVAFGRLHVAPLLPDFLAAHPGLRIDVVLNDRFVDLVEEGVDLAIRIGELADSSLIARRLAANRRLVCAAPDYLTRQSTPRAPADLTGHNCLVYTYRASRNDWHFIGPDGARQTAQVAGNLEANNAEALHAAVRAGLGLGLLPHWLVGRDLAEGRLVELLPDFHAPDSAIYAVYPPGRHLSPKVRGFVDFLAARYARPDAWLAVAEGEDSDIHK